MTMFVLVGVACCILFYRAAYHERLTPWVWAAASVVLTLLVTVLLNRIGFVVLAQAGLFALMWWYNIQQAERRRRSKTK